MGTLRQVAALLLLISAGLAPGTASADAALCREAGQTDNSGKTDKTGGTRLTEGGTTLVVRFPDGKVRVGRPFPIELTACRADGSPVRFARVDAWMPAHGHGMNYTPTEKALGDGQRRYDGFLFHMPGMWELRADIVTSTGRARFRVPIKVGP